MKKLALAVLLSTIGAGAAQAQSATQVNLAGARLLFEGSLNMSGCTIDNAVGAYGDITVKMPASLGVGEIKTLASGDATGWANLNTPVKYNKGMGGFTIGMECPTDGIYSYIFDLMGTNAGVDAAAVETAFPSKAQLYFFGAGDNASGFIKGTNAVGVLAADTSSPNQTVGIAVMYDPGGSKEEVLNLDATKSIDGVPVALTWTSGTSASGGGTTIKASPTFQFAYVPATTVADVRGGITTATLPFKIIYK